MFYLPATPEDAARIVRDRVIPAAQVEVHHRREACTQGIAVGIEVAPAHVREAGEGRALIPREQAEAGITRAFQPWHVDVEPDPRRRWAAYMHPMSPTTLRNFADVQSHGELRHVEDDHAIARLEQLRQNPVPQTFDLDHLRAIHRQVFRDVHLWAGETRTVDMMRAGQGPSFSPWDQIEERWAALAERVADARGPGMTMRGAFVERAAEFYNEVNTIHAFREGNGRTQREWMDDLARDSGYRLDWPSVHGRANDLASRAAREGNMVPLRAMLDRITVAHVSPLSAEQREQQQASRASALSSAAFGTRPGQRPAAAPGSSTPGQRPAAAPGSSTPGLPSSSTLRREQGYER